MTLTSKISTIFLLLGIFPLGAQSLSDSDREKIINRAKVFVEALGNREESRLKGALVAGIEVRYISKPELKKKIDAMISSEISALDYLQLVSGYNMHKFLKEFDGRRWEIPTRPEIPREILDEKIEASGGAKRYYFIKFQMQVNEEQTATAQVKTFSRLVEIDFIPDGDDFKIFGFIL